jgi:DNA (cytosine-5)-methyltransferase 1
MASPRARSTMEAPGLRHLSLCAGIGGIDLGFERAGMVTVGQVERDDYCRGVLARHWPTVPRHDLLETTVDWVKANQVQADVVSAGIPCQPFSQAGPRRGVSDERWLWPALYAVVRALRPAYVVVENVPAILRTPAWPQILADLARARFDAQWTVLSACTVGAPHLRDRVFLMAYSHSLLGSQRSTESEPLPFRALPLRRRSNGHTPWSLGPPRVPPSNRVGWLVNGVSARMVHAAGNAVVPQVAEIVGTSVMDHWNRSQHGARA